jgi:hypothetical protein
MLSILVEFPSYSTILTNIGEVALPFFADFKMIIYVACGLAIIVATIKVITIIGIDGILSVASGGWGALKGRVPSVKYRTRRDVYVHYDKAKDAVPHYYKTYNPPGQDTDEA